MKRGERLRMRTAVGDRGINEKGVMTALLAGSLAQFAAFPTCAGDFYFHRRTEAAGGSITETNKRGKRTGTGEYICILCRGRSPQDD